MTQAMTDDVAREGRTTGVWPRRLRRVLVLGLLVYASLVLAVGLGQRKLQYFPDASPAQLDAALLPRARAETLTAADGERLLAWWIPPARPEARSYLYLHGNGSNLAARQRRFAALTADGSGLMALSWRGYGGSTGEPTEAGLWQDAQAAWQALSQRVPASQIVVFGESLGTTVAVMLAAEKAGRAATRPAAVVLDSGFTSALALARDRYPMLPVSLLMRDPFRADEAAPQVTLPVFQVHCADDPITPLGSGQALQALLPQGRPVEVLDGRCHVPGIDRWQAALQRFLDGLPAARP